jgi:prepilin-type N-terminal cleavage/methylation domain-containing protein
MRLIQRNHRGFTLIELIVALAITGFITGGITTTIFQVITIEARTSNHMTAVRQVQNAGFWVSHDAFMAQNVDDNPPAPEVLKLTWTDWDDTVHEVTYTLEGTDFSDFWRNHDEDGNIQRMRVAQYIDSVSCQIDPLDKRKLTLTVTAKVGGGREEAIETREYEVIPRPGI